jgi:hypothetical protein
VPAEEKRNEEIFQGNNGGNFCSHRVNLYRLYGRESWQGGFFRRQHLIGDKYVELDAGGGGDLLANGDTITDTITDTNSPTSIMDLISKYVFGDVGGGEAEKEN